MKYTPTMSRPMSATIAMRERISTSRNSGGSATLCEVYRASARADKPYRAGAVQSSLVSISVIEFVE